MKVKIETNKFSINKEEDLMKIIKKKTGKKY